MQWIAFRISLHIRYYINLLHCGGFKLRYFWLKKASAKEGVKLSKSVIPLRAYHHKANI
jgi:hypothetical protein